MGTNFPFDTQVLLKIKPLACYSCWITSLGIFKQIPCTLGLPEPCHSPAKLTAALLREQNGGQGGYKPGLCSSMGRRAGDPTPKTLRHLPHLSHTQPASSLTGIAQLRGPSWASIIAFNKSRIQNLDSSRLHVMDSWKWGQKLYFNSKWTSHGINRMYTRKMSF